MRDFIIIGSGTSGSVMSYYLTKAGFDCLLLEAGKEYTAKTFPGNEMDYNAQMFWNGGMDINANATLAFLRAKCVGGGSVVNQCLLDRFDEFALEPWRKESRIDFFTEDALAPHYDEVESHISLQKIPKKHWNRNAEIFVEGFEKLGYKWAPLRRGQTDCAIEQGNDCIVCLGGCPRDSKQSMLVTFLPKAKDNGLSLETDVEVLKIKDHGDKITVHARKNESSVEYEARHCVLAAGALGTTKIMLASGFKKELPVVGEGFFCHPQIMNFAVFDEPVDSHKGAFQAVKSDDMGMRQQGFKLENVFAPPIAVAMLLPGFGKKHQEWMRRYRYLACIEVAVRDVGRGKIGLDKHGRLKIDKKLTKEDRRRAERGISTVHEIFRAVGAKEIFTAPFWFGLHLMGGCAIGVDPKKSVVDRNFQVRGHPNLYISDSSVFPAAPGLNPALTIMALTHRASQSIIDNI